MIGDGRWETKCMRCMHGVVLGKDAFSCPRCGVTVCHHMGSRTLARESDPVDFQGMNYLTGQMRTSVCGNCANIAAGAAVCAKCGTQSVVAHDGVPCPVCHVAREWITPADYRKVYGREPKIVEETSDAAL